jgi:hypothetical protein
MGRTGEACAIPQSEKSVINGLSMIAEREPKREVYRERESFS